RRFCARPIVRQAPEECPPALPATPLPHVREATRETPGTAAGNPAVRWRSVRTHNFDKARSDPPSLARDHGFRHARVRIDAATGCGCDQTARSSAPAVRRCRFQRVRPAKRRWRRAPARAPTVPRPTPRQSRRSLLAALHWDRRSEPRGRDKCGPSYHLHRRLFLLRIKHAKAGLSRATVAKREPAGAAHLERVLAGLAVRG